MVKEAVRTYIVFPPDVVAAVDRVAGKRRRSEFITEAVREKLTRELQKAALTRTVGALAERDYPEWETPEIVSDWVHNRRQEDDAHTAAKLRGSSRP